MMDATIIICTLFLFHVVNGQFMHSTIVFSPSELITDKLLPNSTHSVKSALRYGFHRTSECDNYEKAFLCIKKCLDKGYDIAYSDKYCFCTCYVNKLKAKYVPKYSSSGTTWKLGIPETKKPAWIKKLEDSTLKTAPESVTIFKKLSTEFGGDSTINSNGGENKDDKLEFSTTKSNNSQISSDGKNETDYVTQTSSTNATNSAKENDITNVTDATASAKESDVTNATGSGTTNATDIVKENNVTNTNNKTEGGIANITNNIKKNDSSNATGNKIDSDPIDAISGLKFSNGSNASDSKSGSDTKNAIDSVKLSKVSNTTISNASINSTNDVIATTSKINSTTKA